MNTKKYNTQAFLLIRLQPDIQKNKKHFLLTPTDRLQSIILLLCNIGMPLSKRGFEIYGKKRFQLNDTSGGIIQEQTCKKYCISNEFGL